MLESAPERAQGLFLFPARGNACLSRLAAGLRRDEMAGRFASLTGQGRKPQRFEAVQF
jgi:hypothetical protein